MSADGSPPQANTAQDTQDGAARRGKHSAAAESGVIHDIGYRHYSGPRLGRGYILTSLYLDGFRGAFGLGRSTRSKVMPLLLVATMCVPALVIAILVGVTRASELPLPYTRYAVALQLALSIYVAAVAPATVSRDLRYRTVSLYFSRPLSRADYVLARYAAMASAVFVLLAVPLTLLFCGALLAKLEPAAQAKGYLAGLAGAVLFSLLLAGIGLLIASVTPRRGFGVAAVIAVLLILNAIGSTLQAIASSENQQTAAGYLGAVNPFTLVDGVQVWALNAEPSSPVGPPGTTGGLVFLALAVAVVLSCYGLLLVRYRKVSVS